MKITKSHLDRIIREELSAYRSEVNRKKKRKNRNKKSKTELEREKPWEVFPGYDDRNGGLKQLANGITETDVVLRDPDELEDEDQEEDLIDEECLGNKWRDGSGRFSSESDHEVVTHGYRGDNTSRDCDFGKWKKGKSGTSHKCGRAPSGKKHPHVCKTGDLRESVIVNEGIKYISIPYLVRLLETQARSSLLEVNNKQLANACRQAGYTTSQEAFKTLVTTINTLHRSMKGELHKPEKQ